MALVELLGDTVVIKDGSDVKDVSVQSLQDEGGVVGIYFSAHWCPPCRGFTPVLAEFYDTHKKAGKKINIVFVSSDRGESDWAGYFNEMPWHALKFSDRDRKGKLAEKYGVTGIPTLVILNAQTGETVDDKGRATVASSKGNWPASWGN